MNTFAPPAARKIATVLLVLPVIRVAVSDQRIDVAVAVHVAEHDGSRVVGQGRKVRRGGAGEDARAAVEVEAVLLVVPDENVEVAVTVHVAQRDRTREIEQDREVRRRNVREHSRAIVEVQAVLLAGRVTVSHERVEITTAPTSGAHFR